MEYPSDVVWGRKGGGEFIRIAVQGVGGIQKLRSPHLSRYFGGGREWGVGSVLRTGRESPDIPCCRRLGAKGAADVSYHLRSASGDQKKLHLLTKPLL